MYKLRQHKTNNISELGLVFFLILYIVYVISTIQDNSTVPILTILIGGILLYFIKPSISFISFLIPLINPIGRLDLGKLAFLFLLLSFANFFINFNRYLSLIKGDKILNKLLFVSIIFMVYQLFSFTKTDGSNYIEYILLNVRLILGIFLFIPAYYFTVTDRKNLFISVLILSLSTFIFYYFSIFTGYEIFKISEIERGLESNINRISVGIDFRYLIKIIAYFLPVLFIYKLKSNLLRYILILGGIMAYGVLFTGLLRLDTFYTFIGGIICVVLLKKDFGTNAIIPKIVVVISVVLILFFVFNKQFINLYDTYINTTKALTNKVEDVSYNYRFETELPLIQAFIYKNPLFGVGFYSLSHENTDMWILADMPAYASIAIYGIIGILIYLLRYFLIFKAFKKFKVPKWVFNSYRIEVILIYGLASFFIAMLFFKLYLILAELSYGWAYVEFGVLIGVFFGLLRFIEIISKNKSF